MLRKILVAAAFGFVPAGVLFTGGGCAAQNGGRPYALTGNQQVDQQERQQREQWTDDKGHYRPDLRYQGGAPLRKLRGGESSPSS